MIYRDTKLKETHPIQLLKSLGFSGGFFPPSRSAFLVLFKHVEFRNQSRPARSHFIKDPPNFPSQLGPLTPRTHPSIMSRWSNHSRVFLWFASKLTASLNIIISVLQEIQRGQSVLWSVFRITFEAEAQQCCFADFSAFWDVPVRSNKEHVTCEFHLVFSFRRRESVYPHAVTLTTQQLPSETRILSKPKVVVKVIRFWENRRAGVL